MNKINGVQFGWKNCWFVFKTNAYENVKNVISNNLKFKTATNFPNGVKEGWDGNWALFKPIDNNIILLSSSGNLLFDQIQKFSLLINEVHFYSSHSSSNYLRFTIARNGQIFRDFSVSDDEIIVNIGYVTEIELELANLHKQEQLKSWDKDEKMIDYINNREILSFLGDFEDITKISETFSVNTFKLNEILVEDYAEIYFH